MQYRYRFRSDDPESLKRLPFGPHWVLYLMAVLFLGFAVLLIFVGRQAVADARLLAAEGVVAQATVGEKVVTETRSRDSNDRWRTTYSYRVDLRFTTGSGEVIEVEQIVQEARFDSLEQGQVVQIYYVPSRPTLIGFEKDAGDGGAWIFWAIGAVLGLVGLGLGIGGRALQRRMAAATSL